MSTENVDKISAAQCRGARGLLDMTQPDLARAAGLGLQLSSILNAIGAMSRKRPLPLFAELWRQLASNSSRKMEEAQGCASAGGSLEEGKGGT